MTSCIHDSELRVIEAKEFIRTAEQRVTYMPLYGFIAVILAARCYICLQWHTESDKKSYIIYQILSFLITLNDPDTDFKDTPLFDVVYLRNGTRYIQLQRNANRNLHTPYSTV